ncbi:hypothetical protein G7Y89_g11138 [Cudoniella acicularis]|uniref:NmrA-like domain-containing protein n=1 Tax=Cudoniella acicularis TaxID=354080 RepID=A0A8H4W0D8_9HELO|nr:hypothetical protein G7Y89_g11138 [Cudoniella acicularis]
MAKTILVTGATGMQGSSVVREVLAAGFLVNALVRNTSSPKALELAALEGVTIFEGDYDDLEAIKAATVGVTGVFLNTFPSFTDPTTETRHAENFIAAAKVSGTVTTFIASTVFRASQAVAFLSSPSKAAKFPFLAKYYASKSSVEKAVLESGIKNVTILRPTWLGYQYLAPYCEIHFKEWRKEHVLVTGFERGYKQGHCDPYDVGKFAGKVFEKPDIFGGENSGVGFRA